MQRYSVNPEAVVGDIAIALGVIALASFLTLLESQNGLAVA